MVGASGRTSLVLGPRGTGCIVLNHDGQAQALGQQLGKWHVHYPGDVWPIAKGASPIDQAGGTQAHRDDPAVARRRRPIAEIAGQSHEPIYDRIGTARRRHFAERQGLVSGRVRYQAQELGTAKIKATDEGRDHAHPA